MAAERANSLLLAGIATPSPSAPTPAHGGEAAARGGWGTKIRRSASPSGLAGDVVYEGCAVYRGVLSTQELGFEMQKAANPSQEGYEKETARTNLAKRKEASPLSKVQVKPKPPEVGFTT